MASQNNGKYAFNVVAGPSKFDLMVSLFEGNPQHRRTVSFKLEGLRQEVHVAITSVQQEDDSGESWIFKGFVEGFPTADAKGYYSSRTRSGHFNFLTPVRSRMENGEVVHTIDVDADKRLSESLDCIREDLNKDFSDIIRKARRM